MTPLSNGPSVEATGGKYILGGGGTCFAFPVRRDVLIVVGVEVSFLMLGVVIVVVVMLMVLVLVAVVVRDRNISM